MKVLVPIRKNNRGMHSFDEVALEEAIRWKEQNLINQIIIVSIGSALATENLRAGLAMGADKAILWETDEIWESLNIAKLLCTTIKEEAPDIVIMGDHDVDQNAQMIAAMLNWPQAISASKIVFSHDKKQMNITCEVDDGLEIIQLKQPCVITVDLSLNTPRYLSIPDIMKADSKIIQQRAITSNLNIRHRIKILKTEVLKTQTPAIKLKDVAELVHYLRDIEQLI